MKRLNTLSHAISLSALSVLGSGCEDQGQQRAVETFTVFAASSLTDVLPALTSRFEETRPHTKIRINFAGSQVLRLQIEEGAEFQFFASANQQHLQKLVDQKLISDQFEFARNRLVVIVPADNPQGLETYLELPRAAHIVVAEESVPLGAYTIQFLTQTSQIEEHHGFAEAVKAQIVSRESNARLVRAKVELGEADAAVVYESDTFHSNKVRALPIPDTVNVETRYFVGISTQAKASTGIPAFVQFLRSSAATQILETHGFRVKAFAEDATGAAP